MRRPNKDNSNILFQLANIPYVVHIGVMLIGGLVGIAAGYCFMPSISQNTIPWVPGVLGIFVAFAAQCLYLKKYPSK